MGLNTINTSPSHPENGLRKVNLDFLMTWNGGGGGGGSYMSADANGFAYAMDNPGYCRYDPPSGAAPHEFRHVWECTRAGFNGSDSPGAWWECTANWMMLQFLNSRPRGAGYIQNSMYYPAHGQERREASFKKKAVSGS